VFVATASLGDESLAEESGTVAEELLVEDPVCVFDADVDVDHVAGEEPEKCIVSDRLCSISSGSVKTYSWSSFCLGRAAIVRVLRGCLVCGLMKDGRPMSRLVCAAKLSTSSFTCLRQRRGYSYRSERERRQGREDVADTFAR
jgi:hypothetical protein